VDVQTQWQRSTDALAASLAREISDSAGVSISETGSGFGALEAALRAAPERTGLRSVLVLDEFDLLFEGGPGNEPFPELSTLFGLLRGLSQTGIPLTLVMIGRDPDLPGRPLLNGVTNPLMAWSEPRWVAPFGKDAATDLLRRLGRRMGLHFGPTSAADAYTLTGGHPFLDRQFGAAVFSCMSGPIRATERREAEGIPDAESVFLERQRVCDTRREVFELLETRYPSAFEMLTRLAVAPESERIRLWEARDRDPGAMLSRLVQFGVLKFDGPRLWLPRVWEHTGRLAAGAPGLLQAG
jgi:hypothetical protein